MGDFVVYESCTCASLRKRLKERKASTKGTKAELIARLKMLDGVENIKIEPRNTKRKAVEMGANATKQRKTKSKQMMHAIREQLNCPICTCTMRGRIYQCQEGHTICEKCIKKIDRCPYCRSRKLSARNRALEALASELSVSCAYHVKGCRFKAESSEIGLHEQKCVYRPIKCPFRCGHQCTKERLVDHLVKYHKGKIGSFQEIPLKRPHELSESHWYPPLITRSDGGAQVMTCAHSDGNDNIKVKFLSISVKPQAGVSGCGAPIVKVKLYPSGKTRPVWSICNTAMHLRSNTGADSHVNSYMSLLSVPERVISSYSKTTACIEVSVKNS